MAIVVIGGLITSTFLSLLVIPVVFTYVDDLQRWLKRWIRLRGEAPLPEGANLRRHPAPTSLCGTTPP
jgi:hypothetical protein